MNEKELREYVFWQKGTEAPFSGKFNEHFEDGTYICANCKTKLFSSKTKFNSHCGWPSFYETFSKHCIKEKPDFSHNMSRTEVLCANCNAHLGHVFDDSINPTGLRYCINSICLEFENENGK